MLIGKVVGTVVSTRKLDNLVGSKFLIVETSRHLNDNKRFVAVDLVGAGIGEFVLVATGSAARVENKNASIDASIVGIIDHENEISVVDR